MPKTEREPVIEYGDDVPENEIPYPWGPWQEPDRSKQSLYLPNGQPVPNHGGRLGRRGHASRGQCCGTY